MLSQAQFANREPDIRGGGRRDRPFARAVVVFEVLESGVSSPRPGLVIGKASLHVTREGLQLKLKIPERGDRTALIRWVVERCMMAIP